MISVRVTKALPGFNLDVDFTAPARGITALFGRSGAGKTSVIRAIAGALRPDKGRIAISDSVFFDSTAQIDQPVHKRRVGYVFQDARLFPHLSVEYNLLYGFKRAQAPRRFEPDPIIALLDLGSILKRRTHMLSGGERQRVAIGRALLSQPALLLMDEPLSSLDPPRKAELLPYIEGLRDRFELPILYISHAFNEVLRLADQLVVIEAGKAVRSGPLLDIAADRQLTELIGRFDAGSIIECTIASHDERAAMSTLAFRGGELRVPSVELPVGQHLRVRIRARDVAIALAEPQNISITNRLSGRIVAMAAEDGPYTEVVVDVGGTSIRALITRESVGRLALSPGMQVWALIKSVAFDPRAVGFIRRRHPEPDESA